MKLDFHNFPQRVADAQHQPMVTRWCQCQRLSANQTILHITLPPHLLLRPLVSRRPEDLNKAQPTARRPPRPLVRPFQQPTDSRRSRTRTHSHTHNTRPPTSSRLLQGTPFSSFRLCQAYPPCPRYQLDRRTESGRSSTFWVLLFGYACGLKQYIVVRV